MSESKSNTMNIAVLVTGSVYGSQDALSAFHYVRAALANGHTIQRVFFYNDGVLNGSNLVSPAADEFDLHRAWVELANQHDFSLDICASAALRRGIVDHREADKSDLQHHNLALPFQLTGLGQLAESIMTAERLVQF